MDTSKLSQYVVPDVDVVDGDIITITSGGATRKFEEGNSRLQVEVELPTGIKKLITINNTSLKQLQEKYGYESNEWIGKQAKVAIGMLVISISPKK